MKFVRTATIVPKNQKTTESIFEKRSNICFKENCFFLKDSNKRKFYIKDKLDHSQFSDANKIETILSAIAKLLHKAEDNNHSKVQETLELKKTVAKKTSILTNL